MVTSSVGCFNFGDDGSNFSIKHSDVFKGGLPIDFCDVFLFELGFNVESDSHFECIGLKGLLTNA
jgi:hypothetical protein